LPSAPAEALSKLLEGRGVEGKGRITSSSDGLRTLRNGIKYFAVEVSSEDGTQYGISAYGEEAIELFAVATSKYKTQNRPVPLVRV
jgi:hypothetical protein